MKLNVSKDINPEDDLMSVETYIKILCAAVFVRSFDLQIVGYLLELSQPQIVQGYVKRGSDQRARASMRVQAIGACVSYVTATGGRV